METAERLDFDGVKGVRKPRTVLSRKPKSGGSHTSFLNEENHSWPWSTPPLDPRDVVNSDKGLNGATDEYLESYTQGDDYTRRLGNINVMGRFEMLKDDLGWSLKSGYRMASGEDGLVPEMDEIKRARREFGDLNGKHLGKSLDGERNCDRGGSKSWDYEYSKSYEKPSREKSHGDSKESKDYSTGEKVERAGSRFSKTFKSKCNGDDLDRLGRFHGSGLVKGDFNESNDSHKRLEHDLDRNQNQDRDRSPDVQGSMKCSKGVQGLGHSHKPLDIVGLGKGGISEDCCISDGHKLERRSLYYHPLTNLTGRMHSEPSRLPDGSWRAEGRTMQNSYVEYSKLFSKGPNWGEVKTTDVRSRTSDSKDPEVLVKSLPQQDDRPSHEVQLTKVKVDGVRHTVHANSTGNAGGIKKSGAEGSSVFAKPPNASEGRRRRQRLILQEDSDNEDDFPVSVEIRELPKRKPQVNMWASIAKMDIHPAKEDQKGDLVDEVTPGKQVKLTNNVAANQPVRKSSRIPKKRVLDGAYNMDDDAERALQNKSSRTTKKCVRNGEYDEDEECETLQRRSSRIPKKRMLDVEYEEDVQVQQHKRRRKRSKYQTDSEHLYYEDAEEAAAWRDKDTGKTDVDLEGMKNRSEKEQEVGNSIVEDDKEVPLTARQRTMQSCKDAGSEVGANLIEFPGGLPQTTRRKRKEILSEVEQQLKKTEAAQKRKLQLEKAANAAQAEAIKKILGKDSSKKKRADKLQKQRDAMAQRKVASDMSLASNGVRWVMGPSGTVVTFSENTGLPSIFNNPCRYPPPREKCAGPFCNNTYKYRDSRTNLPLCSLQCYRAMHTV